MCVVLFYFFLCWAVLYRSIQFMQHEGGHDFQCTLLAHKSRQTFGVSLLLGRTMQVVQHSVGHSFQGTKLEEVVQLYGFGHIFQGRNCGGLFGAVRYFSWLEM
jgi:hypothetical protein